MRTTPRETIFQAFETSAESVSITLVLAAFGELEKSINSELRKKWLISSPKTFREAVFLGAAEGFSQPYRTLGKLARFIFYNHPDVVLGLGEVVTFPQPDRADPGECFDIAEALKNIGKASAEHYSDHFAERKWYELALEFYSRMPNPDEYKLVMNAECLIRRELFAQALTILDKSASATHLASWWQRRAQALLDLNEPGEAFNSIMEAIENLPDQKFMSAMLQVKARAEFAMGVPQAVDTLSDAIRRTDNNKFRAELEAELEQVKKHFA